MAKQGRRKSEGERRADYAAFMADSVGADSRLPCKPIGSAMAPDHGVSKCHCGAFIVPRPVWTHPESTGDWQYVDIWDESAIVDTAPPGFHEPDFWDRLAKENIGAYSNLSARWNLGMLATYHLHHPKETVSRGRDFTPPDCHGWPMWAAPKGWVCRVWGTVFKYKGKPKWWSQ